MDATKTGIFIAQLRKEKGYTQKTLADKLHVSDKAISRWETGKGFPDTSLLKPLSDTLGISIGELLAGEYIEQDVVKEKADYVIVSSMKTSQKKLKRNRAICICLAVLLAVSLFFAFLPMMVTLSPIDFVNQSRTYMLYHLGSSSNSLHYNDMIQVEFTNGYQLYLPNGTQRYVFSYIEGSSEPVLSYMHHSGEGMLLGFRIGSNTVIPGNQDLGINDHSLRQYLKDNGFSYPHNDSNFGRPSLVYIDGERCNWYTYVRENVFINICLSAYEGNRLMGYDIGLIDTSLNVVFDEMRVGFSVTVEDPNHVVANEIAMVYPQWENITITASKEYSGEVLYLYINGQLIDKFTDTITFQMWGAPITVLVTPEPVKE